MDIVDKPVIYERMGVQAYFLYDPTADDLTPALQGYLLIDGDLREILNTNGRLRCKTLGVALSLREYDLVIVDHETGIDQVTRADSEALAKEQAKNAGTGSSNRRRETHPRTGRRTPTTQERQLVMLSNDATSLSL